MTFRPLVRVSLAFSVVLTPMAQDMLANFEGHDGMVRAVAFSPDGKLVASGGSINVETNDWSVKIYSIAAEDSQGWTFVRELIPSNKKNRFEDQVMCVVFSHDGTRVAVGDEKGAHIFDISDNDPQQWRHIRQMMTHKDGWTRALAFSLNDQRIFSTSDEQTTVMWDMTNTDVKEWTKRRILKGHRGGNFAISMSPDGKMLATGGADLTIRIWDITDENPKIWKEMEIRNFTAHTRIIRALHWSADGTTLVSSSDDSTAKVFDVSRSDPAQWKEVAVLQGHTSTIPGVCISSDAKYIATGSADASVKIWSWAGEDRMSWKEVASFGCRETPDDATCKGHHSALRGVSFYRSGERFLLGSVSDDGTLRLWDMRTLPIASKHEL